MIRLELLEAIAAENVGMRAKDVAYVLDVFFDEIAQCLADNGRVKLRGFGSLSTRQRAARQGRNPRTGEVVDVQAKRILHFKAGKDMRARLNTDQ
jgi:integration host factor subunit beta